MTGGAFNMVIHSTMVRAGSASSGRSLVITNSSTMTIVDSYVLGSTAVYITGSTGTYLGGNIFVATNTFGDALRMTGGSVNLTLTTSTLIGGTLGSGLYMDPGITGLITVTTNTIHGGRYGVRIDAQPASVNLSSNTILPGLSTDYDTFGVHLSAATNVSLYDNAVVYRRPDSMGGFRSYGIYALSAVYGQS